MQFYSRLSYMAQSCGSHIDTISDPWRTSMIAVSRMYKTKWQDHVKAKNVFEKAETISSEAIVLKNQLLWPSCPHARQTSSQADLLFQDYRWCTVPSWMKEALQRYLTSQPQTLPHRNPDFRDRSDRQKRLEVVHTQGREPI